MSVAVKILPILEDVKKALGVSNDGPGTQAKASQNNKMSTAAAAKKLAELNKKTKASRTAATTVNATGAKRKK